MVKQKLSWPKAGEFKALLDKCGEKMSTSTLDKAVDLAVKDAPYAYKDACMLLETGMKGKAAFGKARLNIFYILSAICRKSKKQNGAKDKYCGRLAPRLETVAGLLAELPSDIWPAVGKVIKHWQKDDTFPADSLAHFSEFKDEKGEAPLRPNGGVPAIQNAVDLATGPTVEDEQINFSPANEFILPAEPEPLLKSVAAEKPVTNKTSSSGWGKGLQARIQSGTTPTSLSEAKPVSSQDLLQPLNSLTRGQTPGSIRREGTLSSGRLATPSTPGEEETWGRSRQHISKAKWGSLTAPVDYKPLASPKIDQGRDLKKTGPVPPPLIPSKHTRENEERERERRDREHEERRKKYEVYQPRINRDEAQQDQLRKHIPVEGNKKEETLPLPPPPKISQYMEDRLFKGQSENVATETKTESNTGRKRRSRWDTNNQGTSIPNPPPPISNPQPSETPPTAPSSSTNGYENYRNGVGSSEHKAKRESEGRNAEKGERRKRPKFSESGGNDAFGAGPKDEEFAQPPLPPPQETQAPPISISFQGPQSALPPVMPPQQPNWSHAMPGVAPPRPPPGAPPPPPPASSSAAGLAPPPPPSNFIPPPGPPAGSPVKTAQELVQNFANAAMHSLSQNGPAPPPPKSSRWEAKENPKQKLSAVEQAIAMARQTAAEQRMS